ncbi:MAG: hypothetical protein K2N94_02490 [Lachnospiraceae bacterium]|nr:hypothetical protein [Lachnospiraceae bacterium]
MNYAVKKEQNQETEQIRAYRPEMPEIIRMADEICSAKVLELLKERGAEYLFIERDAFRVVGRRCVTPDGGGAWGVARGDGTIQKLEALETGRPFCSLCFGFLADGSNDNMVAVEYEKDIEGLESFSYPPHRWLVYVLSGKISEDVLGNAWWYINNKLLAELNIRKDNLPTIESFIEWDTGQDRCSIEICIPYTQE